MAIVLQGRVGRYQTLLHAVPDPKLNAVLAQVIGRASRPFLQTMILDAGRDNHALPGQAVVDARGMIGRIYLAGERTSWVILLTDLNSRIPVTIAPGQHPGDHDRRQHANPALEMVLHTVTLHAGDQVVSSGDGGLLPPGLPVGTVVQDTAGNWRVAAAGRSRRRPGCGDPEFRQAAGSSCRPPPSFPPRPPASSPRRRRRRRPLSAAAAPPAPSRCAASPRRHSPPHRRPPPTKIEDRCMATPGTPRQSHLACGSLTALVPLSVRPCWPC